MVALIFTAFSIIGYNASLKSILRYGLILASLIWLVRAMSVPFGLHTLVGVFGFILIMHKIAKVSLVNSFYVTFFVQFMLASLETIVHFTVNKVFGVVFVTQDWLWILIGWPQIIIILVFGWIIKKWLRPWILSKFKNGGILHG
ncbi:hypothetical protein Desca_0014 [Desulfotomaculum nigrificans CO-1-SRB]|uniref:Uncharacterized protein n=2 Tax=Desulfotomaculum nigrificans TaxID=1565 RepID=F6B3V4_DESCC|nr:hypothetical protein Desca_0014 [Desulfotomaculum nigrificans CO-1-SRB]